MIDIILAIIILIIAGCAGFYIYKKKKKGVHCIGCPYSEACSKKSCACHNCEGNE